MRREYAVGRERSDGFASGGVQFWFEQETRVPKRVVEAVVVMYRWWVLVHGTREVTEAGVLSSGALAARFEVTFWGIEG